MQTATTLGRKYGVSPMVMNQILKILGFLSGDPNDYDLTNKGEVYAIVKEFHRGCGGYSHYNRYWYTRQYDDSILDVLVVTPEIIEQAKQSLANYKQSLKQTSKALIEEVPKVIENSKSISKKNKKGIVTSLFVIRGTLTCLYLKKTN